MAESLYALELNQLVVDIGRSLLQFVDETWPWTARGAAERRNRIAELAQRQREHVAEIVELLYERDAEVLFGTYPVTYTDLHYVELDYLMSQLVDNQTSLLGEIEATAKLCSSDSEVVALLDRIASGERAILNELKSLATDTIGA